MQTNNLFEDQNQSDANENENGSIGRRAKLSNVAWLMADKGVKIANAVLVTSVVARHLGPADFGTFAFAGSILTMLTPLITLGFDGVAVREFITNRDCIAVYFWTMVTARMLLAIGLFALTFACLHFGILPTGSTIEAFVILICCIPLFSLSLDTTRLLYQIDVKQKWVVLVSNSFIVVTGVIKVIMVTIGYGLLPIAALNTAGLLATPLALVTLARFQFRLPNLQVPKLSVFKSLLRECWPLILSGLSIALYMNVDLAMIRYLRGSEDVGTYSVAVRLSAFWYFVPTVLAQTIFPGLAMAFSRDGVHYRQQLFEYLQVNTAVAYLSIACAELVMPTLIRLFFGVDFEESIAVFRIHAVAMLFVFFGIARTQHLTLERLHLFGMASTVTGLLFNVALNIVLIPYYAGAGAATATVLSFGISAFLSSFFFSKTREIGFLQLRAMWLPISLSGVRDT